MRCPPPLSGSVGGGQQTSLRRGTISFSVIAAGGWQRFALTASAELTQILPKYGKAYLNEECCGKVHII